MDRMPVVKPRRLVRGDAVSLVAPSGAASGPDRIEASIRALEALGLAVKHSEHLGERRGYLAGDDATRASELTKAFEDPDTAGVVCLKGGYGTPRILDRIDYSAIAAHPKVFLGYSDITALHAAFRQRTGLATLHGPMPSSDMVPGFDDVSRGALEAMLFDLPGSGHPENASSGYPGSEFPAPIANLSGSPLESIAPGIAEGELAGGNLSLVAALTGTPWELDAKGRILFLEDVDEQPYRVDRMLNQLRLAGYFRRCAGVILGAWTRCEAPEGKPSLDLAQVFRDHLADTGIPVLAGLEAGHCRPTLSLPLGVRYRMDADIGRVELLESPWA